MSIALLSRQAEKLIQKIQRENIRAERYEAEILQLKAQIKKKEESLPTIQRRSVSPAEINSLSPVARSSARSRTMSLVSPTDSNWRQD